MNLFVLHSVTDSVTSISVTNSANSISVTNSANSISVTNSITSNLLANSLTHSLYHRWIHCRAELEGKERQIDVVVVYHVTIVAIGHGSLKKFWPFGTRLRSTHCREFNYLKLCIL